MLIDSYKIGVSYLAILCMKKLRLKKANAFAQGQPSTSGFQLRSVSKPILPFCALLPPRKYIPIS